MRGQFDVNREANLQLVGRVKGGDMYPAGYAFYNIDTNGIELYTTDEATAFAIHGKHGVAMSNLIGIVHRVDASEMRLPVFSVAGRWNDSIKLWIVLGEIQDKNEYIVFGKENKDALAYVRVLTYTEMVKYKEKGNHFLNVNDTGNGKFKGKSGKLQTLSEPSKRNMRVENVDRALHCVRGYVYEAW